MFEAKHYFYWFLLLFLVSFVPLPLQYQSPFPATFAFVSPPSRHLSLVVGPFAFCHDWLVARYLQSLAQMAVPTRGPLSTSDEKHVHLSVSLACSLFIREQKEIN